MLAPILVFTADEAWEFVPGKNVGSVHEATWTPTKFSLTEEERQTWDIIPMIRESALLKLEQSRQAKQIGKSLDAVLHYNAPAFGYVVAKSKTEMLRELCNVSALTVEKGDDACFTVSPASTKGRQKCERCWHWELDVGTCAEHPLICGRCVEAVRQTVR
jgi:isoleucyl-tRNA synthetase